MNDYLWDKSGKPDPDLEKLEGQLSTLRWKPKTFEAGAKTKTAAPPAVVQGPWRARIALAASIALIAGAAIWVRPQGAACRIVGSGTATEGDVMAACGGADSVQLGAGQEIITGSNGSARIELANGIGTIDVRENTRIELEEAHSTQQRLHLEKGTISAFVIAVPRLFIVDTPTATAVDLGCAYTLTVDDHGITHLEVTAGRVELEHRINASNVPAGAACDTRPGNLVGTPYWVDASPQFRAALRRWDFERGPIADVLDAAGPRDVLSLSHMLPRVTGAELPALVEKLAQLSPPPPGVSKAAVLAGQRFAIGAWAEHARVQSEGLPMPRNPWGVMPDGLLPKDERKRKAP